MTKSVTTDLRGTIKKLATEDERRSRYASLDPITQIPEYCERGTCRTEIKTMSFKGTGVCSEQCRKIANGEATTEAAKGAT